MTVVRGFYDGFPSSESDNDVSKTKQQPKHMDEARDRRGKSSNSNRTTYVEDTNVGKPSKQPGATRKSDVEMQKTRNHDVPSPWIKNSDESASGGKKTERKPYNLPDSENFMEVKHTVELRIRLRCICEGCIRRLRETVLKFKGVQTVAVKADKDMVKVIGSMERKELMSYLEEKLGWNLAVLPIKEYDNVVDDRNENKADGVPMADCSLGISSTVKPTCQHSRVDDGIIQPFESALPGDEQKVTRIVVLKIRQYCQEGCVQQTKKTVRSFQGVESVEIDRVEGQVKVTGTMKVEELVSHLKGKLKREVLVVSEKRTENVTNEYQGRLQSGKKIVAEASKGYGEEVEKVPKVVGKLSQVKNVPDGRDTTVPAARKVSNKSKAMSKVHVNNLNELKNGNADQFCPQHDSQYGNVNDEVHHLEKVVKVGARGMHKDENVSGGRDAKSQKVSKKSKVVSRVHPVNLIEPMKVNPDISQNKTLSSINGGAMHYPENSVQGKRQNKVTNPMTFILYCDEEYLEQTRETAMNFEGVESAMIDASKGQIAVVGAVDQQNFQSYLKENLKRDVLVVPSQRNDMTNIYGVNYGHIKTDVDVVQWPQKLEDDAVRCGGDGYRHKGANEVNMKVKVAAFGNVNRAWRNDKLGEAYTDIDGPYPQNYGVDSQSRWMSLPDPSMLSDENVESCSIL